MRDYGKVHSTFWSSQTTRSMSEDGRTLALYLMTCAHNTISGVFRLPDGYICEDIQWSSERVKKGFDELLSKGFANRCETTKWVWICKHLEWNPLDNPNQKKSATKLALSVPDECTWKAEFLDVCADFLDILAHEISNPSVTVSEPLPNQEQEQEQEQKQKSRKTKLAEARAVTGLNQSAFDRWLDYRAERKPPIKTTSLIAAAEELAAFGDQQEIVVKHSIANGYQGLFPPKNSTPAKLMVAHSAQVARPFGS